MTDADKWDALVTDWQEKFNAVIAYPLFEGGMMHNDRLGGYEALVEAERAARCRKDDFIAAYRAIGLAPLTPCP
jgi:hypothetical protein